MTTPKTKKKPAPRIEYIRPGNDGERTERKCLCCSKPFHSWGIGNRMCDACRRLSPGMI